MNREALPTRMLMVLEIVSLVFLAGCGGATNQSLNNQPPPPSPTPTIASISPSSTAAGGAGFTLTITGTNFVTTSMVNFGGAAPATTFVSTTQLTAAIPVAAIASAGTVAVTVANPPPGGGISNAVNFAVTSTTTNTNNAKLSGQYAFLFSGFDSAGSMGVVGSFTADGNGNLIAGNTDVAVVGGTMTNQGLTQSTYSVDSVNSGTMRLNTAVNFPTRSFSLTFSFALDSFSSAEVAGGGRLIESDSTGQTGTGFFVKQDPAAFSTGAINGGYAFGLAGPQGIYENVALGRFTASGGSLSAGHIDLVGFGNNGLQPDQPFSGTYSVDGNGRGGATLNISGQPNPLGLILYVVSSGESLWMDAGGNGATGMALQQSGGHFNTSSLNGTSVFGAAGFTVAGNDVTVGEVQFDGVGNVSGTNDENYFGLSFSDEPITGTYTVDSNGLGRGAISEAHGPGLSTFYLVSPGRGFIISGNDSLEFGTFEPQTGGPFSNASFSGTYALGVVPWLSNVSTNFASGVLSADGVGNLSGTLTTKAETQTFAVTYSVAANGRTTLSTTSGLPLDLVFYFASPLKAAGVQVSNFGRANAAVNVIEK
jgi:IPT/TIG domain